MALPQNEEGSLLEPIGSVAAQNVLNFRQRLRFVLPHERVERQQLQFVVLELVHRDRLANLCLDLDLQCAAVFEPCAGWKVAPQLLAGNKGVVGAAQLVLGISLPVEGAVGVRVILRGDAGEDGNRVGPAALVQSPGSICISAAVGSTAKGRHPLARPDGSDSGEGLPPHGLG